MYRKYLLPLLCTLSLFALSSGFCASPKSQIGIVNFMECLTDSKYGQQERKNFEDVQLEMHKQIQKSEEALDDVMTKLNDQDHLDGLSEGGEKELRTQFEVLQEEMTRHQYQYRQAVGEAQQKLVQDLQKNIDQAAAVVAKNCHLSLIINQDLAFYYDDQLEVTKAVISQMDKTFEDSVKEKKDETKTETR